MDTGETKLQELLKQHGDSYDDPGISISMSATTPANDPADGEQPKTKDSHSQWALGPNQRFIPVGATVDGLEPGVYEPFSEPGSWGLERVHIASDGLYHLPDMATQVILDDVRTFWDSEPLYRKHGLLYKRGVLMWGPPGSGKTVAVKLLMQDIIKQGGIVVLATHVSLTIHALKAIKRIEPNRNLIVVMEDIDEIIRSNGEAQVLSLLDGESSINRVLNLATTNYPELLGARIVNRPSRFDRTLLVGMPSTEARMAYLTKATDGGIAASDLKRWGKDTDGMSIAHLRELIAAVYCLRQPYDTVIARLQAMADRPDEQSGFRSGAAGFIKKLRN